MPKRQTRQIATASKGQELEPSTETSPPRRSPRRSAKPPRTVSNRKRVSLKFDDSLLAKKGMDGVDDDTAPSTKKARQVISETSTVDKDISLPEPSTPSLEQVLSIIASTPGMEEMLRKKYRPVMYSTPPGGESSEPESMSVMSSNSNSN
jgi:hypothetical protein